MYGFMWGYIEQGSEENKNPARRAMKRCFGAGLHAMLLNGYIKPSSVARLTAARRLLTSSFL